MDLVAFKSLVVVRLEPIPEQLHKICILLLSFRIPHHPAQLPVKVQVYGFIVRDKQKELHLIVLVDDGNNVIGADDDLIFGKGGIVGQTKIRLICIILSAEEAVPFSDLP